MPRVQLYRSTRLVEQTNLTDAAPARSVPDRLEYWGLRLIIAFVLLSSSVISLMGLFFFIYWIVSLCVRIATIAFYTLVEQL